MSEQNNQITPPVENEKDYLFNQWTRHYTGLGLSGVIGIPNTTNSDWLVYFNQWLEQMGINFNNLNSDFDALVAEYNKLVAEIPGEISDGINNKFDAERPGMVAEVLNGLEDKIFPDFKQPLGKNFLEKLNNEFNQRGMNITWFGAIGDNLTDNTTAIENAYNAAIDFKTHVFVPTGIYLANFDIVPDNKMFNGNGLIINNGKKFNISTNVNRDNAGKLQNPYAISRYTYGRFNPAAALSVSANTEDEAAVVGINDDSIGLSAYDNRDSVGLYTTNTSSSWHIDAVGITFGADYVEVDSSIDLSLVRIGMFIDTDEVPKSTGIVKKIIGNKIAVNKWVRKGSGDAGVVPLDKSNIIINPVTAIWGQNTVVQLNKDTQSVAAVGYEMDLINYQPHRENIDGLTVISDGDFPANAALTARNTRNGLWAYSLLSENSEYGVYHSKGSVGVRIVSPKFTGLRVDNSPVSLYSMGPKDSIMLHATDENDTPIFDMKNSGLMNRFTLQRQLASGNVSAPIIFATGNITLPAPSTYPDNIFYVTNTTSNNITMTGPISYQGKVYQTLLLKANSSAMFVCDGVEFYYSNYTDPIAIP